MSADDLAAQQRDRVLVDAGAEGERLGARIRILLVCRLLLVQAVPAPDPLDNLVGFSLNVLALDGKPVSVALQTTMAGDDQHAACATGMGGQDAVLDFSIPARADLTLEWAQVGSHAFALYANEGPSLACDAGKLVACFAGNGQSTGKEVMKSVPAGKYHLVIDAHKAGSEGGVVLQLAGVLSP